MHLTTMSRARPRLRGLPLRGFAEKAKKSVHRPFETQRPDRGLLLYAQSPY